MANILTYGFYAKLIFKNSIKSSLVYSLVLAIGLLGDAAFALDAPFVDNASNVDHSLMHTVTNSFEATDPCSCNNDQSFNGAQDGTFSETISITNTAPGEVWTVSAVASLNAGALPTLFVGSSLNFDPANQRHFINFDHRDRSGYLIVIQGPFPVGDPSNASFVQSNICRYPVLRSNIIAGNYNLCETGFIDLSELDEEVNGFPGTLSANGSNLVNLEALGPGTFNINIDYAGDFVSNNNGTAVNMAYPGCNTQVQEQITIISEDQSVVCNSAINISINPDCSINLTPSMLLEAEDNVSYTIELDNGEMATAAGAQEPFIGINWLEHYTFSNTPIGYKITSFCGGRCWGDIILEDKAPPTLDCGDPILASCSQDFSPGSPILEKFIFRTNVGSTIEGSTQIFSVTPSAFPAGAIIEDINVYFDLDHKSPSQLSASLTDGTNRACLFNAPGSQLTSTVFCTGEDMMITIDDQALNNHDDLTWQCLATTPAHLGSFSSLGLSNAANCPSVFSGTEVGGLVGFAGMPILSSPYTVEIFDENTVSNEIGEVNEIRIEFILRVGEISFPTGDFLLSDLVQPPVNGMYTLENQLICGIEKLQYQDQTVTLNCSGLNNANQKIVRTWTAIDSTGNESSCEQEIYLSNSVINPEADPVPDNDAENIQWPPSFDNIEISSISCFQVKPNESGMTEIPLDANGHPDPSYTGFPYDILSTSQVFNELGVESSGNSFCGNFDIFYTDLEIPTCTGAYKLIRSWSVVDWCTGERFQRNQNIKVEPRPTICANELTDITVAITSGFECGTDYTFDPNLIEVISCGEIINMGVQHLQALTTATDPCQRPPGSDDVDDFVSIGGTEAMVNSDGSYTLEGLPLGCSWVLLYVESDCGQRQTCRFEIEVIDELAPNAVCDQHTIVALGNDGTAMIGADTFDDGSWDNCTLSHFEVAKMTGGCNEEIGVFKDAIGFCCEDVGEPITATLKIFDIYGNFQQCYVEVVVQDKIPPLFTCPADITLDCNTDFLDLSITGVPSNELDACGVLSVNHFDTGALDQCGSATISRRWVITDVNDKQSVCTQLITIEPQELFDLDDITFPADAALYDECLPDLSPSNPAVGNIQFADNSCSQIAANYEDLQFDIQDNACIKILRTWTVIDNCQYQVGGNGVGRWSKVQEIVLFNNVAPVIDSESCNDEVICGFGACSEVVSISASASDDCTVAQDLIWGYRIDLFDDGSYNLAGNGNNISENLPFGSHRLEWSVSDGCGNNTLCDKRITIEDCEAPEPYCVTHIVTAVMPSNGFLEIVADQWNLASTDNCTSTENLIYTFSTDPNETSRVFDCSDILDGQSQNIKLELWVTDEAGNQDFCRIILTLQDNGPTDSDVCEDILPTSGNLTGVIITENNQPLKNVDLSLDSGQPEFPLLTATEVEGNYLFEEIAFDNDYLISAQLGDAPTNGLSTIDLVMIQRHILGLQQLSSPYQILAADINNNQELSTADIVYLRQLILGLRTELSNDQREWRFVPQSYVFADSSWPFDFEEEIELPNLNSDKSLLNFIGYKVGDLNFSASLDGFTSTEIRVNETLQIQTENVEFAADQEVLVPIRAKDFNDIIGFQFTMEFDIDQLEFTKITSGALQITKGNIGDMIANRGVMTVSWNEVVAKNVIEDEILFTLVFKSKDRGNLKEVLSLSSEITEKEAYRSDLRVMGLDLLISDKIQLVENSEYYLFQNKPNPFSRETTIEFSLPKADFAKITVIDLSGKIVFEKESHFERGVNQINPNLNPSLKSGFLFYKLESGSFSATKKMLLID